MSQSPQRHNETPPQLGPYRIEGLLGEGGMGVVWRAVHPETGAAVALKTVRLPSPSLLAGLRREILALRKVHHPGVVKIDDVGVEAGLPWYAMEYVEGVTLRSWIAALHPASRDEDGPATAEALRPAAPDQTTAAVPRPVAAVDGPRPAVSATPALRPAAGGQIDRVLRLFRGLCGPLGAVHGQGIVHRDIKPANVMVRADDSPVLMDFGIVSRVQGPAGREVLDVSTHAVGTAAYMAPEQIVAERVDARADLYALGCMLYEALVGRPPFEGRSAMEVVGMHLMRSPTPPSLRVEGVSPALDALVLRLLQKNPRDRFGHAADVAAALTALLGDVPAPAQPGDAAPNPAAYLYRPALLGREGLVQSLLERIGGLDRGVGGCVLLGGESGVGKTRVAAEVARHAATRRMLTLAGECVPMPRPDATLHDAVSTFESHPDPSLVVRTAGLERGVSRGAVLHPFRALFVAIADRCRAQGEEATAQFLGPRAKILAPYEPALAMVPGVDEYPDPADIAAPAARRRLLDALADTLAALGRAEPLLLVLDDLQWADDLTLAFLQGLPPKWFERNAVFVLGTYRTQEFDEALARVIASPAVETVLVEGLDARAVGALVGDMLALPTPPAHLVDFLAAQAQGNPFFAAEYLRMAVAEGLLGRDDQGRWMVPDQLDALPRPTDLRALVGRRLQGLSGPSHDLVAVAAVLGREADAGSLAEVAGRSEAEVADALRELLLRQVMEEAAESRLRFVHDKLREVAYDAVPDATRRALHQAAAEALARRYADAPQLPLFYPDLAHHWHKAGNPREEARWAALAGEFAYTNGAFPDALRFFERALAHTDADEVSAQHWRWQAGDAAFAIGDLRRATALLGAATAPFGARVPSGGVRRLWFLLRQGVERLWRRRREAVPALPDARREALAVASLAAGRYSNVCIYRSDGVGMLASSLAAANLAERAGESHVDALAALGFALGIVGLHDAARRSFARARVAKSAYDATSDRHASRWRGRGALTVLEGTYRLGRDEVDDARRIIATGLDEARARGDLLDAAFCEYLLATVDHFRGRLGLARTRLRHALERLGDDLLGQRVPFVVTEAQLLCLLGEADTAHLRLLALAPDAARGDRLVESMTLATRALVSHRRGDGEGALHTADKAWSLAPNPRTVPATGHVLYESLADVFSAAWALHRDAATAARLRRLARATNTWAAAFPIARPFALNVDGLARLAAGDRLGAAARWRTALDLARAAPQPLEALRALRALLSHADLNGDTRAAYATQRDALDAETTLPDPDARPSVL